jgi:hypothetical protein
VEELGVVVHNYNPRLWKWRYISPPSVKPHLLYQTKRSRGMALLVEQGQSSEFNPHYYKTISRTRKKQELIDYLGFFEIGSQYMT